MKTLHADDYYEEIWNTWNDMTEICTCDVCTNNLHTEKECETITKQKLFNVPLRSCPFCHNNIPENEYHDQSEHGHIKIVQSQVTCRRKDPTN